MPDFNPNEMDALFREGAERHEFEYNADAWTLMEEKLDQKDRRRRGLYFVLGLFILVAAVGSYFYMDFGQQNQKMDVANVISTNTEEISKKDINIISSDIAEPIKQTAITSIQSDSKNEYITTDSKESGSNIGAQNSFQSENTGNLIGNEIVSIPSQSRTVSNELQNAEGIVEETNNITKEIKIPETIVINEKKDFLTIPFLGNKMLPEFDIPSNELESSDLEITQTSIKPLMLTNSNRFAFTVFANPEWSSVGLFQESKTGWSFGTRFGYQFSEKFEISAGVAYSRKIYKGAGTEYNMAGGWYEDIEPMQMDAKCDVIEIPLTLAYYMNGYRNSGFFADLGISSYMMHSEWYGFEYSQALTARPERYKEVIEEDANSHLVGVGRFAIGYQKVLSNKTSLQIAPYLQFPLTGIGAGQVNVYSSGVQVAVKFNTQ